jgi:hypothetical protein
MRWVSLFFLLFIAVLLESTVVSMPLVFIILLCGAVVFASPAIFFWAFFTGIVLDAMMLQILGARSLFLLLVLTVAFLYQRKFEIQRLRFILIFSFLGSLLYGWIFEYDYVLMQAIIASVVAGGLFFVMQQVVHSKKGNL